MDWGLVIMMVLGGLVSTGFGWIAMNHLSRGKDPHLSHLPNRDRHPAPGNRLI